MMKEMELYSIWKKNANRELQEELAAIAGDVDALEDRF